MRPETDREKIMIAEYKSAVWDFVLEHCDITDNGTIFVKFHTSDRLNFENRILSRLKYGYHRKDDRSNFDNEQKEKLARSLQSAHQSRKEAKKNSYEKAKATRKQTAVIHRQENIQGVESVYNIIKLWLGKKKT